MQLLIDRGASVEVLSGNGESAICFAVRHCNEKTVKLLLGKGASIDPTSVYGRRSLMVVAKRGQDKVMRLLLGNQPDMNEVIRAMESQVETTRKVTRTRAQIDPNEMVASTKATRRAELDAGDVSRDNDDDSGDSDISSDPPYSDDSSTPPEAASCVVVEDD